MKDYPIEIDDYLNGKMSILEQQMFEEKLRTDAILAKEFKLQKEMLAVYGGKDWVEGDKNILKTDRAKQLRSFFQSEEASDLKVTIQAVVTGNRKNVNHKKLWSIGIAATVVILFMVSLFVFKDNSYDDLYGTYIHLDEIPSLVTRGNRTHSLLEKAQLLFEEKEYDRAVQFFSEYHQKETTINPLSYIYNGIAYIELGKFDNALEQFELLEQSKTLQAKKANWYKALVFLKQKNKVALKSILQTIISDNSNYKYTEAKEILEVID
ncbi:hypothetical protein M0D21_13990 [Aquimarina sp. D1M17]|uniref:tetratricopeptide repeat protein n=1 Tax=Aquimarina acroporae TaxID=2937283 RepID=UPI0020BF3BA5|nr:hypothetical protein [Aquimarina acroporae]MCK8522691.1 hypothetical protein [Aquimarina acroporae]